MKRLLVFACFSVIFSSCLKDSGQLKVTYLEAEAVYGDIQSVRSAELVLPPREIENPGKIYVSKNHILIGEEEQGIHLFENRENANPQPLAFLQIPGNREFIVNGDFIYAESYYDVLKIDWSSPEMPVLVQRIANVFSEDIQNDKGESLVGFTFQQVTQYVDENSDLLKEINSGNTVYRDFARRIIPKSSLPTSFAGGGHGSNPTTNRLAFHRGHLYLIGRDDLYIFRDEGDFNWVHKMSNAGNEMETVFPLGDHLFVGTRTAVELFNVQIPDRPERLYRFTHATSCDPVLPTEQAAYITLRTAEFSACPGNINALVTLNLQDITRPEIVSEIQMRSPYGMLKRNNELWVGEGENGLTVFDVTNALNPKVLRRYPELKAYDVLAHPFDGQTLLIAGPSQLTQLAFGSDHTYVATGRIDY